MASFQLVKEGDLPWYYIMITVDPLSKDIEIRNELIKQILIQLGVKVADFQEVFRFIQQFSKRHNYSLNRI